MRVVVYWVAQNGTRLSCVTRLEDTALQLQHIQPLKF